MFASGRNNVASALAVSLVALLTLLALNGVASAVTRTWTGAVDNDWYNPANWNPAGTPAATDDLVVDSGGTPSTDYPAVNVYVASHGSGTLSVLEGGEVTIGGLIIGTPNPNDTLVLQVDGLIWVWDTLLITDSVGRVGQEQIHAGTLTIAAGEQFDIDDGKLVVCNDTGVYDLVRSGFNGAAWDGPGLASTAAATAGDTALGCVNNADLGYSLWMGNWVQWYDTLVLYTYYGDVDLDGDVDDDDVDVFEASYPMASGATWADGDVDYDGDVDPDDLSAFADNYGKPDLYP